MDGINKDISRQSKRFDSSRFPLQSYEAPKYHGGSRVGARTIDVGD